MFFNIFKRNNKETPKDSEKPYKQEKYTKKKASNKIQSTRIGELGEYKINIQLDQLPKDSKYLSDLLIANGKSKTGYSQIDHIVFTPYALFVIETKNYAGTIYGDRNKAKWSVNGKFPMINPFNQNFGHIQAIKSILRNTDYSSFVSMVSFTKRSTFKINEELRKMQSNELIVYDTELSEYITRKLNVLKLQHKKVTFSNEELLNMYNKLREENIIDSKIREKHVELLKANNNGKSNEVKQFENATCTECGKEVSEKVKVFCLSNKERFKGNVYCLEHQKIQK